MLLQMHRHQGKATQIMKDQANMISLPKETNKAPATDPKEMESQEFPDKEFEMFVLRKFSELQENTDG